MDQGQDSGAHTEGPLEAIRDREMTIMVIGTIDHSDNTGEETGFTQDQTRIGTIKVIKTKVIEIPPKTDHREEDTGRVPNRETIIALVEVVITWVVDTAKVEEVAIKGHSHAKSCLQYMLL